MSDRIFLDGTWSPISRDKARYLYGQGILVPVTAEEHAFGPLKPKPKKEDPKP